MRSPKNPSAHLYFFAYSTGVTVQGSNVAITSGDSALAAIDTGTTLIGGPTADVNAIWKAVPGASAIQGQSGFFSFRKSSFNWLMRL